MPGEANTGGGAFPDGRCPAIDGSVLRKRQLIYRPQTRHLAYTSRSEGFPLAAYLVPGRDGMGVWPNSEIVRAADASSANPD